MDSRAKTKIVVLDACRNNPFVDQFRTIVHKSGERRDVGEGLARIDPPEKVEKLQSEGYNTYGSIIAFAAAPGATASDGMGDNSPYTTALLQQIERPGVEVGRMFRLAAAHVVQETEGGQKPEYLVRLTDEVFFSRPQPADCDYFAIAPYNQVGIPGVEFDAIKPARAIAACEEALEADADNPRYLHNLGRAFDAAALYSKAVEFYRRSAELGYVPALNNLGVMHINGQGTDQNFNEGIRLLKQARDRGYRLAKVGLRSADFTVLFENAEFKVLQSALKDGGFYSGAVDGDFGTGSQAALEAFQKARGLALNGATLETLDALGIVDVIPPYELN
jgi:tetratricopeptide (TPR) repeat protein